MALIPTKKIPQLTDYGFALNGNEQLEVWVAGTSRRITARQFALPIDALLTAVDSSSTLPAARFLTAAAPITLTDNGAGHSMEIGFQGTGALPGNPTALVGLTPVNGIANTWMRSDGAPALDQGIAPIWTALHTYSSTNPRTNWNESDAAANNRLWGVDVQSEQFRQGVLTDLGVFAPWIAVDRTAQIIDSITLFGPILANAAIRGNVTSHATGANQALDLSLGNTFYETLGGNTAFTFTNPPLTGREQTFTIYLRQDGVGTRVPTWPASVHWSDGLTPVLTTTINRVDAVTLTTVDGGTTYYGGQVLANMVP